jgi:hypothetical protein
VISGIVLLVVAASWTWLSHQFVYGEAHAERPILEYLALFLLGWVVYLTGFLALAAKGERPSLKWILGIGIGCRLILFPSGLIQENDVYRYVLDGQVLLHGENPFQFSPLVVSEMASEDLRASLESPEAQLVLQRVGYPQVSTIYPPAAQAAFAAGALIGGWNWVGQRVIFLLIDLILMFSLIRALQSLSINTSWLLVYAWNPLILKEIANSAHLDVLVALCLVFLIISLLHYGRSPSISALTLAATSLGMAILAKLYPVILMPACILFLFRLKAGWKTAAWFAGFSAGVVLLGYLPFLSVEFELLTAGLTAYSNQWRMNDGVFSLVTLLTDAPRVATAFIISLLALAVPILRGSRNGAELAIDFHWILLLWYLLIPTPFPWYAVPLVALAVMRPTGPGALATVVLSGATGLYYLSFYYEYQELTRAWWIWTRAVEHSLIWGTIFLALTIEGRRSKVEGRRSNLRLTTDS